MTANEARIITDEKRKKIKENHITLAKSFRESVNEEIKEAAENGNYSCIIKMKPKTDPEIKDYILLFFQEDGFVGCVVGDEIHIKW